MNLAQRAAATQATYDKYRGVVFSWQGATCIHVARFHLRGMGHKPRKLPAFRSAIGALTALEKAGAADLAGLLAAQGLLEIPPAKMIVGDIAVLPGDEGRTDGIHAALAICAGNKFMGWHGAAEGLVMMDDVMPHITAAFRV